MLLYVFWCWKHLTLCTPRWWVQAAHNQEAAWGEEANSNLALSGWVSETKWNLGENWNDGHPQLILRDMCERISEPTACKKYVAAILPCAVNIMLLEVFVLGGLRSHHLVILSILLYQELLGSWLSTPTPPSRNEMYCCLGTVLSATSPWPWWLVSHVITRKYKP